MKIAVSGKGGVGKSTVAASIALLLAQRGQRVLALDTDPDANLGAALGFPSTLPVKPISREIELIEERTGAKVSQYGQIFKINPDVADVADKLAVKHNGVELLVLGAINKGGGGCACPENTFIKALVTDLVLFKNETLVMDMEAGIEHLGRSTASGVDVMVVVMEPGQRSIDCAASVMRLSRDIGLDRFVLVGNKVTNEEDRAYIASAFPEQEITAFLPYSQNIRNADRDGVSVLEGMNKEETAVIEGILSKIWEKDPL